MRQAILTTSIVCALGLLSLPQPCSAGNYTTSVTQAGGQNWNAAIWLLDGAGTAVAPTAGNTYECVSNGTAFANSAGNTRIRNPAAAGLQTFPGDSLKLGANTEIRMKQAGAILNFPGVGGNPGLILDGGIFNVGDDAVFVVTGKVQVASQSYIAPGDNGGGGLKPLRAVTVDALLSGTGTMVIFQAATNLAQKFTNPSNTFSGEWIVKAGLLQGTAENSLGTNNITIDPAYVLPLDPGILDIPGPAVFEPNYDLNSGGALSLVNGGLMRLHQTCAFTAVSIEGVSLTSGTHLYSELLTSYPNSFEPGGAGAIVVQPYGTPPVLPPQIVTQPASQMVYTGRTAHFTVAAVGKGPFSYQWRKGVADLADGGSVSGATSATLTLSNVTAADAGTYTVLVSNAGGNIASAGATLSLAIPTTEAYETAILAASPVAYYRLDETADPATGASAFDYVGGYVGTYGTTVQNGNAKYGIAGPLPSGGFPGFGASNKAAQFANGIGTDRITVEPWNLNTNSVTITTWIKPEATQVASEGIVFCRGGGTVAGLNYTSTNDASGNFTLGYTWNDEADTYNWDSGLVAPAGQWSFIALSVGPTQAVLYVMNAAGTVSSTHVYPHVVQAFGGTTLIGDDSNDDGNGGRVFSGTVDEVAVFNATLSQSEVINLYSAASGIALFPPAIGAQPASQSLYAGQTARLTVGASGTAPLSYQWRVGTNGVYTDVKDDSRITGAKTATLAIQNLAAGDAADYIVVIQNSLGSITSSVATLTVMPTSPAENITMSDQEPGGSDWNTGIYWSDGLAASESAAAKPGSTYELLAGARLRSPVPPIVATFPGDLLTVDGDGVWINNPAAGTTMAEIRFKQPPAGTVIFKKLVMNGGQLDSGNDGVVVIGGEIEIRTNTPIYNDNAADRGYRIVAKLSGTGTIEYHGYNQGSFLPAYINNLEIAGTNNTFSGKWNVVLGTLLGTAPGALGTNDIMVSTNGAFETTYDMANPDASLILDGRMYLHQNDRFRSVTVAGTALAAGTYTFAQLNAAYPSNFPATWTPQTGATNYTAGSGGITVGNAPAGVTLQYQLTGSSLKLTWSNGILLEADEVVGPWQTNSASSPVTVSTAVGKKFYRVQVQ